MSSFHWLTWFRNTLANPVRPRSPRGVARSEASRPGTAQILEVRTLLAAPHPFDLEVIDGSDAFQLEGFRAKSQTGITVAGAGDVNGDGFDDVIIAAESLSELHGGTVAMRGESYVVFGKADGFSYAFELDNLDGTDGFQIDRGAEGRSVSGAGDVNGDGFDDLIIGAPMADPGGITNSGESYLIFGKADGFTGRFNVRSLDGSNGFRLVGVDAGDRFGHSVSSAGDVNGDGFSDLIIGANDAGDSQAGESYVVFGKPSGFASTVDVSTLDGTNGFRLDGIDPIDSFGHSVSSAGDVNGDGFDDIIIGAIGGNPGGNNIAGESYVVFGKSGGFASAIDLSTLDGMTGFRIDGIDVGDQSGTSVSTAGDVNGDGFDDIIIGAIGGNPGGNSEAGESYVVFGKSGGFASAIDLSTLDGMNGFRIDGIDAGDLAGTSVSSAGDVNGDGFDDIIIGAPFAEPGGNSQAGESYVVFGKSSFPSIVPLGTLDGTNGFQIDAVDPVDESGRAVSGAGDVNGDGFDDLIIGAPMADPGGITNSGESYVVFGGNFTGGVETQVGTAGENTLTANQGAGAIDILVGGQGSDTLISDGGQDVLYGGEGDDTLAIVSTAFQRVAGGNGTDTLRLDGSGLTLDLTTLADNTLTDIEVIDITGSGANTLTLDFQEVVNLSSTSNTLTVRTNGDDTVNIGSGWFHAANQTIDSVTYQVFTQGAATVLAVNAAPTLNALLNVSIDEDASEQTVNLAGISSGGGESQPLRVTASSSNTGLIPNPAVTYTTANATGSIAFTPEADQSGTATITVTVEDGGLDNNLSTAGDNATFSRTFEVTVNHLDDFGDAPSPHPVTLAEDGARHGEDEQWQQLGIDIDGEAAGDYAYAISLSGDGNILALGANWNDGNGDQSGHTRIFQWSGTAWQQMGNDIDGEAAGDRFGEYVSLSDDGTTVAIGAEFNDDGGSNSGHVRVFRWDGTDWNQLGNDIDGEAALDYSGVVDINADGTIVAIGSSMRDKSAESGHVRIFGWDGTTWNQMGSNIDGEGAGDRFGEDVALSDDGTTVAIWSSHNPAHVQVHRWDGAAWVQIGDGFEDESGEVYSGKLSLNSNGNILAIGDYGDSSSGHGTEAGRVGIFEWNGVVWDQLGSDFTGEAAGDNFGISVSLSNPGHTVAIGAANATNAAGIKTGYANVFKWNGTAWSQVGSTIDGEAPDDLSGWRVSLSGNGKKLAVSAPKNDDNGTDIIGREAGHVRIHGLSAPTLGATWDEEADGTHSAAADADGVDEDGVTFGVIQVGALDATVTVNVQNAPAGAKLDAWMDFNQDGDWDDAGEQILTNTAVINGDNVLTFSVPSSASVGTTYARVRLSTAGGLAVTGSADDGEVEDYEIEIAAQEDFGDAPSTYPVTRSENGAQHTLTGPMLGATRDAEVDGLHSAAADADGSDEDGVVDTGGFLVVGDTGASVTINVQNAPGGAKLDAWMDFNQDGDWDDAGEQILTNTAVINGDNVLTFSVPSSASVGTTYARVRLSTAGGLAVTGSADDGEVEDYEIEIAAPPFSLPAGGGHYEILRDGADLVLRIQGGAELLRNTASGVEFLNLPGSQAGDVVDVLNTGIAVTTPIVFDGKGGNDQFNGGLSRGANTLLGGLGDDTLSGGISNDSISGGAGTDLVFAGSGDDLVDGGADDDELFGDAGNDTITGSTGRDLIFGGDGNDDLDGGSEFDTLSGDRGNDTISGGADDDTVFGGTGRDNIFGDEGNDLLFGDSGYDTISGGLGNDLIRGGRGRDRLSGNAGQDEIIGDEHNDTLSGGDDNDTLSAGSGADRVFAGAGNDVVDGGSGDDRLYGDAGSDTLSGSTGRDLVRGGNDNDLLNGDDGLDTLFGDRGNDTITGGDGNDTVFGGNGRDSVSGGGGNDRIFGNNGYDTISGGVGNDFIRGGRGRDSLTGDAGDDELIGDEHEDTLIGGSGSDRVTGGTGADTIDVQEAPQPDGIDSVIGSDMTDTVFTDPADLLI